VGKGGTAFTFYKFRSMFCNADDRIHRDYVTSLIRNGGQRVDDKGEEKSTWTKLRYDPRVTPVGAVIRKTKLDELPQLFNVLKGDLSLVGPRPPLPYEVENYEAWHLRRILSVKPGITGIWQTEGRDDTTFDDMVRMDLRYIRTWSVLLDLKILIKTAIVVFRSGAGERTAAESLHKGTGKPVRTEA
jgi:lipopolysaccharide/colanic/teichoic acid biosynthesis glycosyltransferase